MNTICQSPANSIRFLLSKHHNMVFDSQSVATCYAVRGSYDPAFFFLFSTLGHPKSKFSDLLFYNTSNDANDDTKSWVKA